MLVVNIGIIVLILALGLMFDLGSILKQESELCLLL